MQTGPAVVSPQQGAPCTTTREDVYAVNVAKTIIEDEKY